MPKIFYDCEFCGFHKGQTADLISIGLVSENGDTFYAEATDFPIDKINNWREQNVIWSLDWYKKLPKDANWREEIANIVPFSDDDFCPNVLINRTWHMKSTGSKEQIAKDLKAWILRLKNPTAIDNTLYFWGDYCTHDWQMLTDLIAEFTQEGNGCPIYPDNVSYMPYDITTLLRLKGKEDVSREALANVRMEYCSPHHALRDAFVIKACYENILTNLINP